MPEPPSVIRVSAHRYRVFFDRAELAEAQKESSSDCMGATNHSQLRIVVDPKLAHDQQVDTLLHEVEHAISHVAGIGDREKITEHEYIHRTNTIRLAVLRDNPALVAFVTAQVEP